MKIAVVKAFDLTENEKMAQEKVALLSNQYIAYKECIIAYAFQL